MKDLFRNTDFFINHLEETVAAIDDDYIKSQYVGIVLLKAATAYEVAVKSLLLEYATEFDDPIVLNFAKDKYGKLSAKIDRNALKKYLALYGVDVKDSFVAKENEREDNSLRDNKMPIKSTYKELLEYRHHFVHQDEPHPNQQQRTFEESIKAYHLGKEVIYAFAEALDLLE